MDNSFLYFLDSGVSTRISRLLTLVDKETLFFLRPVCIFLTSYSRQVREKLWMDKKIKIACLLSNMVMQIFRVKVCTRINKNAPLLDAKK